MPKRIEFNYFNYTNLNSLLKATESEMNRNGEFHDLTVVLAFLAAVAAFSRQVS